MVMKKRGLGRGLGVNALIPEVAEPVVLNRETSVLPINEIEPNREQPRKNFDPEKIEALAESVKEHGIVQPLIVTKEEGYYRIVAGERRWRAAKKAGLKEVPVVIREYTAQEAEEIALIENLQREDLNPIEEALGYKQLMEKFNLTQETVAQKIGKSRSGIANALRLLSLPEKTAKLVQDGVLSVGHAKVLLGADAKQIDALAKEVVEKDLNVRQTEALMNQKPKKEKAKPIKDQNFENAVADSQKKMENKYGTKVKIQYSNGYKGKIELNFKDMKQMISLLDALLK
ncbi:MAG: ParB/RepB/Spo0J family partition protein [Clostridia bacterium]|nr:ParB/RepB/Spo0J family partition protein [Clostridia bacterium]